MKRWKVWMQWQVEDTVEVEAETEKEAESKALEEDHSGCEWAYYDGSVECLDDDEDGSER